MALPLLLAAAAVIGVTDNPCPAPVAMSPALETWQKSA